MINCESTYMQYIVSYIMYLTAYIYCTIHTYIHRYYLCSYRYKVKKS